MANGDVDVKVKICQSDSLPGPKLEVEGVLGSVHILLSPHQIRVLTEMATGIATTGKSDREWLPGAMTSADMVSQVARGVAHKERRHEKYWKPNIPRG